jgi:glycosyltransferase involved in cell wall biosynthesis
MNFSLIICTYNRRKAIEILMNSIVTQSVYPNQIIIVDGSLNDETKIYFETTNFKNLDYFLVDASDRGLTKQRNFGISKVHATSEVVCFLDDDTVLDTDYFFQIINVFKINTKITGVGGVAVNENHWELRDLSKTYHSKRYYVFEDYVIKQSLRNIVRNYLHLNSDLQSGKMPMFSHGRTCGYPLNGKCYQVDLLIGMSMSFRKTVVDSIKFSTYFEGYGLYEDAHFSIKSLAFGENVISTNAKLEHHHDASGRPNQYSYGKMVVRNGWYVWRTKNPNPTFIHAFKWHAITILLTFIRIGNIFTTKKRQEALTESLGRIVGWFSVVFNKPKIIN